MTIVRSIFQILFTAITFVLVPLIAFTLISSKSSLIGGFQSFVVLTGSMSPLIPTGSVVYSKKSEQYLPGDIITFKRGDINVTHRIVEVVDEKGNKISPFISPMPGENKTQKIFYKTKGDANNAVDPESVSAEKIIGKTEFHFPYVGRFIYFLRSLPGFMLFVILPTLIFIAFELWGIKNEIVKNTEKKILERMQYR